HRQDARRCLVGGRALARGRGPALGRASCYSPRWARRGVRTRPALLVWRPVNRRPAASVVLLTRGIGQPRSRGFRLGGPWSIGHDAHRNPFRMTPARYIMVGGFLGAGKTTAILRMAEALDRGG